MDITTPHFNDPDVARQYLEAVVYYFLGKTFGAHHSVNHSVKEYAKRTGGGEKVTTNTVEGYFSILKRGVHGDVSSHQPEAPSPLSERVRFQVQWS